MRVVFVDNLLFEDAEGVRRYVLQPHLGLISLIAVLESAGHEGVLFDPKVEVARGNLRFESGIYREMARQILSLNPDAIGFTSLGCNFICTAKTAAHIKQLDANMPILLGGPHATVLDKIILSHFPQFDVIARNEAECTILPLLEALPRHNFLKIPGITFRLGKTVWQNAGEPVIADLDTIPVPSYGHYPVRELGLTTLRVDAGRGCPFQCTFCSTASFFGRKYRLKSAMRLVHELDHLNQKYGVRDFALTHDLFTVNKKKVIEFCDAVGDRGYTWKCSARMDCVDDELLQRMRQAGCQAIYYGIEAGSARMQDISKKHLDLRLFDPILDTTQRLKMSATVSFITGYPEESTDDQNATLDLIGSCFDRDAAPLNVQLHLLTPEPGTALLDTYQSSIVYDGHISDFNFPMLESDDAAIIEAHPQIFVNHHYFPSVLSRRRHVFVTSSYQVLYALGFPVLRYLLRRCNKRFSQLVDSMFVWAEAMNEPMCCDESMVERYFTAKFGDASHLAGLARYMLKASELRRRAVNEPLVRRSNDGHMTYCLSRRSRILRRSPDCPRILEHLANRNDDPEPSLLRKRFDFLLHLPRPETDLIRNYRITQGSVALLQYFNRPRPWPDSGKFEAETGYPTPPLGFVEAFIDQGVIELTCHATGNA